MRPAALLLSPLLAFACLAARAETVTVFAAASLHDAIETLAADFQSLSGHRVVASYGASSALARQIEAGAPAQVFLSADGDWADYVEKRGLAREGSRREVAGNSLVLVAPVSSTVSIALVPGVSLAGPLGGKRLALANPDAVPAGKYAKAALMSLGAWDGVKTRLAPAENVRAALMFVRRGETPLGIVYRTDAIAETAVRIVATFPPSSHPRIAYPMLVLKRATPAAESFAAFAGSAKSRAIWQHFGFTTP